MADQKEKKEKLEAGTYQVIRDRLNKQGQELRQRITQLNEARKEVFGSVETNLVATERITTEHNCLARDIIALGNNIFWFGYNVHMGLKTETHVADVFSTYRYDAGEHEFHQEKSSLFEDEQFQLDFQNLYKYYRETRFTKFAQIGQHIFMVFQVGKTIDDIKTFKWSKKGEEYVYAGNRSDHEFRFPDQHEFTWKKATRDMHRKGKHPHISIEDRLFIETTEGDLTIKVEDNTDIGRGIYSEPVEDKDQTLDDAEIYYATIGNLIALKVKPYQEKEYRYIVYNEKIQQAVRMDALEDSCVLLPDDQGIIFAKGYYIQTGEVKLFDNQLDNMLFEKRIPSPNGEDFLYVFYQRGSGIYALLSYNIIEQEVATPIICNGFSFFENGELIFFKAEDEQKKHHMIQIWQTPFYSPNRTVEVVNKSYLFKLGNKEVVRAMSEGADVLKLINKDDSYENLYVDLVKLTTDILDSYHWLGHQEAQNLKEPIKDIRESASTAIEEHEKVVRIKKNTRERSQEVMQRADKIISRAKHGSLGSINEYVERLAQLRSSKGEILALRDLRYAQLETIEEYEQKLSAVSDEVSQNTVKFLLKKHALQPYEEKVEKLSQKVDGVKKVVDAKSLEEEILKISGELEMLIEVVSNLKIEDATQTTRIIDTISGIYSQFNRINAALKKKRKELIGKEGEAEFNAQLKLINQGLTNYLDISDTPEKCEEYLNKLMVQLEELEGKFAEFDKFLERIGEKREELYNAFDSKKVYLTEQRSRKALAMQASAERIINGIQKRLHGMKSEAEINTYYASDLMVDKVRDLVKGLLNLGDSVKADDLESKLKSTYEDAMRQLKDKQELFVNGEDLIKLGKHSFNVNTQSIDLSLVKRNDDMFFHITGTNFFEKINSPEFLATRAVWEQNLSSENEKVYRAEFLAYHLFTDSLSDKPHDEEMLPPGELHQMSDKALQAYVQQKMALRYDEGYVKGVHDRDAMLILKGLLNLYHSIGLLRYSSSARTLAYLFWHHLVDDSRKKEWLEIFDRVKSILKVFPNSRSFSGTREELSAEIATANNQIVWANNDMAHEAADYLFHQITGEKELVFSMEAWELSESFENYLKKHRSFKEYESSLKSTEGEWVERFTVIQSWLNSFITITGSEGEHYENDDVREAAAIMMDKNILPPNAHKIPIHTDISELRGEHEVIADGQYRLHYNHFMEKLKDFNQIAVKAFRSYSQRKKELLEQQRDEMRLHEFKPKVMSSFVRNQLLDEVYLPIIGDNLAKQMGAAGSGKRTDLMGMLLLISPPGYGKTTLMEYIANRLGLVFMKINGPAIGHDVTALDPAVAKNSAAREELEKLNLAFEMGDNVMIYVDDIQHCSPEFLQKFISLCDAQRKVEGVYKGVSKTYDLRGKKVAVVMAGNPYTESGDKFKIPDMLANRADIYNLGDIISGKAKAFENSYLENSLTSNSVLAKLNGKSRKDIHTLIKAAESGDHANLDLESNHSPEEVSEYLNLLEKMIRFRNIILKVNKQYILSAGQADEFRTEPPFKLQGSYRNMNKIAEKISPVMNDEELQTLILSHYENESQTLTSGAEFNFLKFKQMLGILSTEEQARMAEIREVFARGQKMKSFGGNQIAPVLEQMESITTGIRDLVRVFQGFDDRPQKEDEPQKEKKPPKSE